MGANPPSQGSNPSSRGANPSPWASCSAGSPKPELNAVTRARDGSYFFFCCPPKCSERCWVMLNSPSPSPTLPSGHSLVPRLPVGTPSSHLAPPSAPPGGFHRDQAAATHVGHGLGAGPRTGGTPSSPPRPKHHPSPQPSSITHVPVPVPITRPERQGLTHRGRRPAPILSPAINALDQHRPPAERCWRGHHLAPCTPSTPPVVPSPSPPARRLLARPLTPQQAGTSTHRLGWVLRAGRSDPNTTEQDGGATKARGAGQRHPGELRAASCSCCCSPQPGQ